MKTKAEQWFFGKKDAYLIPLPWNLKTNEAEIIKNNNSLDKILTTAKMFLPPTSQTSYLRDELSSLRVRYHFAGCLCQSKIHIRAENKAMQVGSNHANVSKLSNPARHVSLMLSILLFAMVKQQSFCRLTLFRKQDDNAISSSLIELTVCP